jgi:hypothetical protein
LEKLVGNEWNGFDWFRTKFIGRLLWTRSENFLFYNRQLSDAVNQYCPTDFWMQIVASPLWIAAAWTAYAIIPTLFTTVPPKRPTGIMISSRWLCTLSLAGRSIKYVCHSSSEMTWTNHVSLLCSTEHELIPRLPYVKCQNEL